MLQKCEKVSYILIDETLAYYEIFDPQSITFVEKIRDDAGNGEAFLKKIIISNKNILEYLKLRGAAKDQDIQDV